MVSLEGHVAACFIGMAMRTIPFGSGRISRQFQNCASICRSGGRAATTKTLSASPYRFAKQKIFKDRKALRAHGQSCVTASNKSGTQRSTTTAALHMVGTTTLKCLILRPSQHLARKNGKNPR